MSVFRKFLVVLLVVGLALGGLYWVFELQTRNRMLETRIRTLATELDLLRDRQAAEEQSAGEQLPMVAPSPEATEPTAVPPSSGKGAEKRRSAHSAERYDRFAENRVTVLQRFIPLSVDQREQLREKYALEAKAREEGVQASTPSFESIVGQENAEFYRKRRESAFERSRDEALKKEVYFYSRSLGLSEAQEIRFEEALREAEDRVKEERQKLRASSQKPSRAFFLEMILAGRNLRRETLQRSLPGFLSDKQVEQFWEEESTSAAAELELFHVLPDESEEVPGPEGGS